MSNTSKRYTAEFKRDAVALVHSSGKTVTEVAREIGVSPEGLRNWVNQDRADRGQGAASALTSEEKEELRRLRRENREQQQTIDSLAKKAAAFFARESTKWPCATRSSTRRRPPAAVAAAASGLVRPERTGGGRMHHHDAPQEEEPAEHLRFWAYLSKLEQVTEADEVDLVPRQATFAPSRRPARPLAAPAESPSTSSTRTSGRHTESTHRTPLLDGQTLPAAALVSEVLTDPDQTMAQSAVLRHLDRRATDLHSSSAYEPWAEKMTQATTRYPFLTRRLREWCLFRTVTLGQPWRPDTLLESSDWLQLKTAEAANAAALEILADRGRTNRSVTRPG